MKTQLVTTLKRQATKILSDLARDQSPVLITQHGIPTAYLVDVATFEALQNRLRILEGIARGERAIQEGRTHTAPGRAAIKAMAKIIWADPAIQELDAIADCVALDKPEAARQLVQRVFAAVARAIRN